MRKFLAISLLTFSFSSQAEIEIDKYYHFGVSAAVGGASQALFDSPSASMAVCLAIGLAKESYDQVSYGGFSKDDMVANAIGCAAGVATSEIAGWKIEPSYFDWDGSYGASISKKF